MGEHEQAPPQLPAVSSWQPRSKYLTLSGDTVPPVTFTPPWDKSHLRWTDLSISGHLSPMLNCGCLGQLHSRLQHNHYLPKIRQNEPRLWSLVASTAKASKQPLEDYKFYYLLQLLNLNQLVGGRRTL